MVESVESEKRPALSGWPMILGWLAMLIFAFHASTHMVGAGDTWVAMACGRHFLNHGVDTVEPFSANSHRAGPTEQEVRKWPGWAQWITDKVGLDTVKYWHPTGWVNQNWLTHVVFYWLTHLSPFADAETYSFNTLVYWKFAIYIITVICVFYMARILGVNPALSAVFACFAMFAGRSFLDIRPAGFSNVLVAIFLLVLVLATYRNILYIWLIVPVTVFWCNVHGGYIYVFIMLVPFVGLHLLINLTRKWTAILYNITAWPFLYLVADRMDLARLNRMQQQQALLKLFLLFLCLVVLDYVLIFLKEKLVSIKWRGLWHTIAAGFAIFVAAVIFNPFHLTNLTHTFIISVSEHAKMWREVREWHPAFAWSNPVGTGFPYLVLLVLGIGLPVLWLFSRFLKPKLLRAPKNELDAQEKLFNTLSKIFGYAAAVLICWAAFISLSFTEANAASFFTCAFLVGVLLLSIYKSVHFIYLAIPLTLAALLASKSQNGYAGTYIYPFCLLPAYVILHVVVSMFTKTVKTSTLNIIFVAAAALVAVALMTVLFNPFEFEPLSDIRQFLHIRRPWRSRYEANLGLTYKHLFPVLYILNIASVISWLVLPTLRKWLGRLPDKIDEPIQEHTYELPKIDLSLITIVALTMYMAYRSRRFIPIAAIAACPVVAMFIDQMTRTISAARNFYSKKFFAVNSMPRSLQMFFVLAGAVAVLLFGVWWGHRFKVVYLDAWPADPKLTSVFIRMTASHAKPFYACKFIRDNKLEGKMFNYWTEGGFIAWGQEPDPTTGRTPLQLFMDGRAQAAYEPGVYRTWSTIMSGGPHVQSATMRKQKLTAADYAKIGKWIGQQLKGRNVWVVLMPLSDPKITGGPFIKGLEHDTNWQLVFFNDKQKLFVDRTTPQGAALLDGVFNGKTIYPDQFSRYLVIAHNLVSFAKDMDAKKQGLEFAIKAFEITPSQAAMQQIIYAARFAELKPRVDAFCKNYFDDFVKNKDQYARQDGYFHRIWTALVVATRLAKVAAAERNTELEKFYMDKRKEFDGERLPLRRTKRW